jgi:hypothetical protein
MGNIFYRLFREASNTLICEVTNRQPVVKLRSTLLARFGAICQRPKQHLSSQWFSRGDTLPVKLGHWSGERGWLTKLILGPSGMAVSVSSADGPCSVCGEVR